MKHFISLEITHLTLDSLIFLAQVLIQAGKTVTPAAIFPFEPKFQAITCTPVQTGVEHVPGSIGERRSLVCAALLLAVGVRVICTPLAGRRVLTAACQHEPCADRLVDDGLGGAARVGSTDGSRVTEEQW